MLTRIDLSILAYLGLLGLLAVSGAVVATVERGTLSNSPRRAADAATISTGDSLSDQDAQQHLWTGVLPKLIASQRKCPVTNERLPEEPAWTVVGSRVVFVCCPPCGKHVQAEPEKYVRRLEDQAI